MPVVKFESINTTLPELCPNDLSTDQQYLFQMCCDIRDGNCPATLAAKDPGKMSHARWLTTANRLLRLYVATSNTSSSLNILTQYILMVYAPVWFEIKTKPFIYDGAKHLWKAISASRIFSPEVRKIIDKVFAGNCFFAHHENILLAMLVDSRRHIRELAVRRIEKARLQTQEVIRIFRVPSINLTAEDYIYLIYWQNISITEPSLTFKLPLKELEDIIQGTLVPDFGKFSCHTQAVERCVKIVTEASSNYYFILI